LLKEIEKDALADAFVEGRERFDVESSLSAADRVCRRATAYLSRYAGEEEASFLASCLREIVVNAVEHGNLRIGFDEKSESMKSGRYFELLQERRLDPRYRSLRVVVEYSISSSRATFRVTDEGSGFDHLKYDKGAEGMPDAELLEHGRGLFITMGAFDKVLFNDKGNQVTLVKFFGGTKAAEPS
jgi:anti-sigma regulatory factor (Ser/Thr protein kinase)